MGLCEGADGQHCTFLASTSRKHLPHILQKLRYRGASAEVGVWRGDYSSMILSSWRSGGTLPGEPSSSPTATAACTAGVT